MFFHVLKVIKSEQKSIINPDVNHQAISKKSAIVSKIAQ